MSSESTARMLRASSDISIPQSAPLPLRKGGAPRFEDFGEANRRGMPRLGVATPSFDAISRSSGAAPGGFLRREPEALCDDESVTAAQLRQMIKTLEQEREQALYDRQFRSLRHSRRMVLLGKAK